MKLALCLFGYPKGSSVYAADGYQEKYKHLFEQVMEYNPDVFIHCWDEDLEEETVNLFQPKKYFFEKQLDFKDEIAKLNMERFAGGRGNIFKTLSFFYTRKKSNDLRLEYQKENNIEYDCVVTSRFDAGYHNHGRNKTSYIDFNPNLDMSAIYSAYWDQINAGLSDHWFYSQPPNIDVICGIYDKTIEYLQENSEYMNEMMNGCFDTNINDWFSNEFLKEDTEKTNNFHKYEENYCLNNHCLYKWHLYKNNLWQKDKCKFLNKGLWT